jgi:hypothetical protein
VRTLSGRVVAALAVALSSALLAAPASAQSTRYDPRLDFRTLETERFSVHFHQGEDLLARRLVQIADDVSDRLAPQIGRPRGHVHLILVDQADVANGWATVLPYNVIELTAAPPAAHSFIGNAEDWLRVVFTHEYVHVVHLEKSGGWLGSLRHLFGRLPPFYSNLALPDWQIEGLATFEESSVTGRGRIPAGDFRMVLDHAAAAGRFPPLDRATAATVDWPGGHAPYLYGGYFHEYLAKRFGQESLSRLAQETARRLPFFGSLAFRRVYERPLGRLWEDFAADVRSRTAVPDDGTERGGRTRLTRHGFTVTSPLFTRDGRLFYSISNPHGFPALMELTAGGESREVATRYRGDRLAEARGVLVFDQLEVVSQVDVQSDIYAMPLAGGGTRRLTRHARAADPDVSPDGETIVCTVQQSGRRVLATFTLPPPGRPARPVPIISEDETEFSSPRWSPDGRFIAAERRRRGGPSEIVVIDATTRAMRPIVSSAPARNTQPAWLPSGATILFSSDRDGGPFTLYAVDVATSALKRLPAAGAGAHAPALSPDGRRVVFVGYSEDGYDLYSMPVDAEAWAPIPAPDISERRPQAGSASTAPPATIGAYRPWPTLVPRFWVPTLQTDGDDLFVGAGTGGSDALGRHTYSASVAWGLDGRADADVGYAYTRWWPAIVGSFSTDTEDARIGQVRSREFTAGAVFPVRRVRWNSAALAALFAARHSLACAACEAPALSERERGAFRLGWRLSSAKAFGYSISAEEGTSVTATSELTRRYLGAEADAGTFAADVRHYLPVLPRHGVIAARVAGATAWGDDPLRRVFSAGGQGPQPGGFDFGVGAVGLLRGFEESSVLGDHAAVINLDYRFPLAWVQRGVGTLPFFLRSVHGAVFVDVGHAWDRRFRAGDVHRTAGAELSFDTVFASSLSLTITGGIAWRHDGERSRGAAAFGRIGRAF